MTSIGGILLVFACVVVGYLMEKGKIGVLLQPAELIIIFGAAIGTILTAKPGTYPQEDRRGTHWCCEGIPVTKQRYVTLSR